MKEKLLTEKQGTPGAEIESRNVLFLNGLNEAYGAEKHQLLLLPLLKKSSCSLKLQSVIANHLDHTREQITRLADMATGFRKKIADRQSETLLGIGREIEKLIAATLPGSATRDAGLIMVARQLEHYEISVYSSLDQLARTLEYDDILDTLELTLNEEKDMDDLLITLAENYINAEACQE